MPTFFAQAWPATADARTIANFNAYPGISSCSGSSIGDYGASLIVAAALEGSHGDPFERDRNQSGQQKAYEARIKIAKQQGHPREESAVQKSSRIRLVTATEIQSEGRRRGAFLKAAAGSTLWSCHGDGSRLLCLTRICSAYCMVCRRCERSS